MAAIKMTVYNDTPGIGFSIYAFYDHECLHYCKHYFIIAGLLQSIDQKDMEVMDSEVQFQGDDYKVLRVL